MQQINILMCGFLLLVLTTVSHNSLSAQNPSAGQWNAAQMNIGRFYGKVIDDATGKGLGYATVQLLGMRWDSSARKMTQVVVGGQLTRENGEFSLENLPIMGEFTLKINFMGYANYEQKVSFGFTRGGGRPGGGGNPGGGRPSGSGNPAAAAAAGAVEKDLGNIRLNASSEMLKEVTITESLGQVTLALDKKVYKVDKDLTAAGGSAEDALKNIPSLNVDVDGNLTMRNAAPQIFVDGRPTNLTLDQIPADVIENVEVITNPSAKYDASSGAGIVNIVLKKNRRLGYNGNVRAGVDMRGRINTGGDINVRDGKINAFLGGNYNQRRSLSSGTTDRNNLTGTPLTDVFQRNKSHNDGFFASGRGGFDWFISNRNTLTMSGDYRTGQFKSHDDINITTDFKDPLNPFSNNALRVTDNERNFRNGGAQLLFKHLFPKEGKEWTADANLNATSSSNEGIFNTDNYNLPFDARQKQTGESSNEFYTFQTDFVNPLKSGIKLEAGARAAIRNFRSQNASFNYNFGDGEFVRASTFADNYTFQDHVYAGYTTFSKSYKKWGYQAGLRAESSNYTGKLVDVDTSFNIKFPIQFFPSVFLTYKVNEEDNVQLNFSRRINRPNFFQLIPFPDFSDSLNLSRGNPDLTPEFTNSLELSYQNIFNRQHNLLVSAYFKRAENLIVRYQFLERDIANNRDIIVSTFDNSNQSTAYGLEFTLKNTFFKKIDLNSNINLYNSIVDASNVEQKLKAEQFTYFIKENLTVRLPESFTLQVSGSYQSRTVFSIDGGGSGGGGGRGGGGGGGGWHGGTSNTAQGYTIPVWFMDLSLRKDLWKRTASITLSMQDMLRTRRNGSHTEAISFVQDTWRRRDPQLVRLNFSYRFGKFDVSLFRRKNTRVETEGMEF